MNFASTYDEYVWLREQFGYFEGHAISRKVWEGCTPESQENMLDQFRVPLREYRQEQAQAAQKARHYESTHGQVW